MNKPVNQNKEKKLLQAYRLLFSQENNFNINSINDLHLSKIKAAYRAKALETHPDRSKHLGINEKILAKRFRELTSAYQSLYQYIEQKRSEVYRNIKRNSGSNKKTYTKSQWKEYSKNYKKKQEKTSAERNSSNYSYYNNSSYSYKNKSSSSTSGSSRNRTKHNSFIPKNIPKNFELLFGQYLYYSGYITFRMLLDAIFWQRNQRDPYGKIAQKWNLIGTKDIINILRNRNPFEKFGECAVRLGYISIFQHNAIIAKQQNIQSHIGEYFVQEKILSREDLEELLKNHRIHNHSIRVKN